MNTKKMTAIGLTGKEASLYLAALQGGRLSITDLAKRARLKRPTAYLVIENLIKRNLIVPVPVGKNVHYQAGDPIILMREIELKSMILAYILPELRSIYKNNFRKKILNTNNDLQKKSNSDKKKNKLETKRNVSIFNNLFSSLKKK